MEDQQQLKPCPFCGSQADWNAGFGWFSVECTGCHVETEAYAGADDAADVWNRRASPSSSSVLERAREALLGLVELAEDHWPNGATSRKGRAALAEIDRALGGGNAE